MNLWGIFFLMAVMLVGGVLIGLLPDDEKLEQKLFRANHIGK